MKQLIKETLRNTVTNMLGFVITKPEQELVIMRGVSGSGKSTKAKSFVREGIIHSTDDLIDATGNYRGFFTEMIKTGNFVNLSRMHSKNLKNAKLSMDAGVSPIIIDNTNLKANEAKEYIKYALETGYSDDNIKIVDVGTGGLTCEELANRNSHGVPLEKIEKMVKIHKSVGELTLKKIIESKDMYKVSDVLYSAVVLTEKSHNLLINTLGDKIPQGWKVFAHHMTITLGELRDKTDIGKEVSLMVTHLGLSDMALAVLVDGYQSKNENPHITLAINPDGGKPVMSNQITNWKKIRKFEISGIVTEIKK